MFAAIAFIASSVYTSYALDQLLTYRGEGAGVDVQLGIGFALTALLFAFLVRRL